MKTLKQKLFELANTTAPTSMIKPQTRQELEAENERRKAEVKEKRYKLQDRQTFRGIGQMLLGGHLKKYGQIATQAVTTPTGANIVNKGSSIIAPGTQVLDKSGYKNFRLY